MRDNMSLFMRVVFVYLIFIFQVPIIKFLLLSKYFFNIPAKEFLFLLINYISIDANY